MAESAWAFDGVVNADGSVTVPPIAGLKLPAGQHLRLAPVIPGIERITSEPAKLGGAPCIRGYRLSVDRVVERVRRGDSIEDILQAWSFLERDDVTAAINYKAAVEAGLVKEPGPTENDLTATS